MSDPDIEIEADKWEAEQAALADIERGRDVDSCEALRIMDSAVSRALRILDSKSYELYHARLNQTYAKRDMTEAEAEEINKELESEGVESRWVEVHVDGE